MEKRAVELEQDAEKQRWQCKHEEIQAQVQEAMESKVVEEIVTLAVTSHCRSDNLLALNAAIKPRAGEQAVDLEW